jgi:hypothetical protein
LWAHGSDRSRCHSCRSYRRLRCKAATEAAAPVDTDTAGAKERSGHTDVFLHTFGLWRFLSETVTEVVGTEHSFVHDI